MKILLLWSAYRGTATAHQGNVLFEIKSKAIDLEYNPDVCRSFAAYMKRCVPPCHVDFEKGVA